jgi:L-ascorbate metabolism protein UlaG (beta-lactamase superfamily)
MEIQYFGANCVKITTKNASMIIDDNLVKLGRKTVTKAGDIAINTTKNVLNTDAKIVFNQPGEYEVSSVLIQGFATRAHMDDDKSKTATIFKITADDMKILVVGHIFPELSERQLEDIGIIDIIIIPVGGNGFTLDGVGALKLIKKIESKIVIPTHYEDKALKYEVPQQTIESALSGLAMEISESLDKLKLKHGDVGDSTRLILLKRQ